VKNIFLNKNIFDGIFPASILKTDEQLKTHSNHYCTWK